MDKLTDLRGPHNLSEVMTSLMECLSISTPDQANQKLTQYLSTIGVESDLAKIGANTVIKRKKLSEAANMQRMSNNPVALNEEYINTIFQL